jgi:hypothetical protein
MRKTEIDDQPITIIQFDLSKILNDSVIFTIGKRRSGKSWLLREIMYMLSKRNMPYGTIYSGTEHCNPFFKNFFPKLFIKKEFTEKDLNDIIENQRLMVRKVARKMGIDDGRCIENNMLLVMDDMMSDEDIWRKSKSFKKIFTEGRHYNILFMMSLQYVLGIPPALRENIDYVFLFATDGNNLKKIWENYAGVIPTYKLFKHIFMECTRDHKCMVIDKTSTSSRLEDKVFYYKAKDPGKFKFGTSMMWRAHDEYYQSDNEEDDLSLTENEKRLKNITKIYGGEGKNYLINIQ